MGFYTTESFPVQTDPCPKNRVGVFRALHTSRARRFPSQVLESHRETVTTTCETVSGVVEWLSNDPIGLSGGLNQYVFCANDPVNNRDPFGLYWNLGDGKVRISYTTMNGNRFIGVITSASDFRRVFIDAAKAGDKIFNLNMTAHGTELDLVVLGKGWNQSITAGKYCDDDTVGLGSKRDQDILRKAIAENATLKLDICYGGQEGGLASAIKEAVPGASVTAYSGKVGLPFGIFSLPAVSWPWQQGAITY